MTFLATSHHPHTHTWLIQPSGFLPFCRRKSVSRDQTPEKVGEAQLQAQEHPHHNKSES